MRTVRRSVAAAACFAGVWAGNVAPSEVIQTDIPHRHCESVEEQTMYSALYQVALRGALAGRPLDSSQQKRAMLDAGVVATEAMRVGVRPHLAIASYQPYVPGKTEAFRKGDTDGNAGYDASWDGFSKAVTETEVTSGRTMASGAFTATGSNPATHEPGRPPTPYDAMVTASVGVVTVRVLAQDCGQLYVDSR
jgi:hypothetical protein